MRTWVYCSAIALACAMPLAIGAVSTSPNAMSTVGGDDTPISFKFSKPPQNGMGLVDMADLRGKPVLIDFWGTR